MKQFVRYYLRIKSKCMKVTYLFNFIILILLGSCISKELIKEADELAKSDEGEVSFDELFGED